MTTVDDDATAAHLTLDVDGDLKIDNAGGDTFFYTGGNLNDYLKLSIGSNGDATFETVDTASNSADMKFTADGDLLFTYDDTLNLANDITGQQSTDKVKVISQGIGHHMIVAEVDVLAASDTDNGVIKQIGTVKIPQYARITSAVVQIVELSNLGTFNMNLSIGTNSGVSAGTAPANLHELIGAGNSNTGNTDDITGSAADIQIGS